MFSIEKATKDALQGCIIQSRTGIRLYTPDGQSNYRALWTRDFAYMAEYAGNLLDAEDIRKCVEYLLSHADGNGWIPDRVTEDGHALYTAGDEHFPALPNLDNGPFLIFAANACLDKLPQSEAMGQFLAWKDGLCKGLECLPVNSQGLIQNTTTPAHSPYGFTDCVCKTGLLAMETLLLWRAWGMLAKWMRLCGLDASMYTTRQAEIEAVFLPTFLEKSGMLLSATDTCRQIDVWASCYATAIGFPMEAQQRAGIAHWLIEHSSDVVQRGQIRHLPKDVYWEKTFVPVPRGTYQNGAFWATATGWFYEAIAPYDAELALHTLQDVLDDFQSRGIFECVNGEYEKLDSYVVSATNVYYACKRASLPLD